MLSFQNTILQRSETAKFQGPYLYGPHLPTGPALNVYTTHVSCLVYIPPTRDTDEVALDLRKMDP